MALAWIGALLVGGSLGLLGSGGSILTVPILVYLLGQEEKTAIAGSLFIVGTIAAVGGVPFFYRGQVHWRSVLFFGLPGMVGTYLGAWASIPVSGPLQLAVFSMVMLTAAVLMLNAPKTSKESPTDEPRSRFKIILEGLGVGILTGFVGVGGGFLIVPALVLLGGLPMHLAVGTSLVIIALKSMTGFVKYLDILKTQGLAIDWPTLLIFSVLGVFGSLVGRKLGKRVPAQKLQRVFAVFLLVVGLAILGKNLSSMV